MADPVDHFLERHGLDPALGAELRTLLGRTTHDLSALRTLALGDEPDAVEIVPGLEDLGPLGEGAASVVRRVHEPALDRTLALKLAREGSPTAVARFLREARLTASLEHPGIVPIHALGAHADGRPWFTMREIHGGSLRERIRSVHAASEAAGRWAADAEGWTLERLVEAVREVAETAGHAHARGVVHRDLKPDNVVVGTSGEVLVVDWGIAVREGEAATLQVAGTPAYLAPEQARGGPVGPAADVFALGGMLAEVLGGRPPRSGATAEGVLAAARTEPVRPPAPPWPVPPALLGLVIECLDPDPSRRPPHGAALAARLRRWQEGVERREQAAALVARARALGERHRERVARVSSLERELKEARAALRSWDPVARKAPVWALEDALDAERIALDLAGVEVTELLRAALTQDPESREARHALADHHQRAHAEALAAGDEGAARRAELLLRAHDDGRHAEWLAGDGVLDVTTDPPGARVRILRAARADVRAEAPFAEGVSPLAVAAPAGSYVLELTAPGRAPCRLPVLLERSHRWRPPRGALTLPAAGELGPGDVYVAAGPFLAAGDPKAPGAGPRRRVDLPAFVVRALPVTNREYLAFLDDLAARGADPAARSPRLVGDPRPPVGLGPDGRHALLPDAQGDVWDPDWPVFAVSADDARAFAAWEAARTGRPWRLGRPDEWEKAARGVDGRRFPWGDRAESTFAVVRGAQEGRPLPHRAAEAPDVSVYGVRGLAGNVACYTEDAEGRVHAQGGAWSYPIDSGRSAVRSPVPPDRRTPQVGIRLFRDA